MKSQEVIASVIDAQKAEIKRKKYGIPREALKEVQSFENFASIITGIRRCGKSTLMLQIMKKNGDTPLFLNFEDIRLSNFEPSDFTRLNTEIEQRKVKTLFFDEIQLVEKWEIFIHQKLNEGYQVYLTGSNASLLSRELGTHLTGRHLSTELFPFSYNEFLTFNKQENTLNNFEKYMQTGGMPEFVKHKMGQILQQLIDDILFRDIAIRHGIRNVNALREITVFLISNIGKPVSARKLTGLFGITATTTVSDYFSFLRDSYIVDFVPVFDYSIKVQNRNPRKVYSIDLGIFHQVKTTFTEDFGRQLENVVFLHLRRNYKEIYYFNKKGECDFVVMDNGKPVRCIQVCYNLNDMNMDRELNGLKAALDFFGMKKGVIVTHKQSDLFNIDDVTIQLVPAWQFLVTDDDG